MKYETLTIKSLLNNPDSNLLQITNLENKEKMTRLKSSILQKEPELNWPILQDEIIKKGADLLDFKLKSVLEKSWMKYEEIQQYLSDEENSDETFLIPLSEHSIFSEHHPKVEIFWGNHKLGDIEFALILRLKLKGILLRIKQGKIIGVKAGECSSSASFSCEGIPIFENEVAEFEF